MSAVDKWLENKVPGIFAQPYLLVVEWIGKMRSFKVVAFFVVVGCGVWVTWYLGPELNASEAAVVSILWGAVAFIAKFVFDKRYAEYKVRNGLDAGGDRNDVQSR